MTEKNPDGIGSFIGLLLMGASILWMAFCGLCAFGVLASMFTNGGPRANEGGWIVVIFMISAVGAAIGYAVFVVGRNLWRSR